MLAHTRVGLAFLKGWVDSEGAAPIARAEADAAMPIFQAAGDHLGIAMALLLAGEEGRITSMYAPYVHFYEQALQHLRTAGDRYWALWVVGAIAEILPWGATPASEAIARLQGIVQDAGANPGLRARAHIYTGLLLALQGHELEALNAEAEGEAILRELGIEVDLARSAIFAGPTLRLLGRLDRAERLLCDAEEVLERSAEQNMRSTILAELSQVLFEQGRLDDAERTAMHAIEIGASDDCLTLIFAHGTLARVYAKRSNPAAEAEARQALALAEPTDMPWQQGEEWEHLAEALLAQGRRDEANAALQTALDRFERKGASGLADRIRARLVRTDSAERKP
jgi:tetratricopeptide (TPR) repeat protein